VTGLIWCLADVVEEPDPQAGVTVITSARLVAVEIPTSRGQIRYVPGGGS
jgi:hypothetical protein